MNNKLLNNFNDILSKISKSVFGKIRVKLVISFLVPVLFIIILGVVAYTNSAKAITDNFTNGTVTAINKTSDYFGLIMQNIEDKALQIATDTNIKQYYSGKLSGDILAEGNAYKSISSNMANIATSDKYIGNIYIFTNDKKPLSTSTSFDYDAVPYVEFMETEEAALINSSAKTNIWSGNHKYIDEVLKIDSNSYAATLSRQMINENGKAYGFVFTDISMDVITTALSTLGLPESSTFAYITPDGREITMNNSNEEVLFADKSFYQDSVNSEDRYGYEYHKYNGKNQLFIYSKIGETGAMICTMIPKAYLHSQALMIRNLTIILVLIASAIAILIGVYTASGISKEINKMNITLSTASDGDLTAHVKSTRKDEFGVLADSINNMLISMKELIIKASIVGKSVINSTNEVTDNSDMLLHSSKSISVAISEIQQGNTQQAEDTEACLKITDILANQINLVFKNSNDIGNIADVTKNVVADGIEEINKLNNATNASIQITNQTIIDMEDLQKESNSITEIIGVINDIASQTNLLSLNASIEAARAGEAGRGFSVVANEIRNLSNRSVEASQEIENIIKNITNKTQYTVKTVKQAGEITKTTEERLLNVVKLFDNINISVDELVTKLDGIAIGIDEINQSKNGTLTAIESITSIAEQTSAASEEVDAIAIQQLEAVTKLNESSKLLQKDAHDLETSIKIFKTE